MHMLVVGSFDHPALEACYRRALERMGHRVSLFDSLAESARLAPVLRHRIGARMLRSSYQARRFFSRKYNEAFVQRCRETKPDVVFVVYGYFMFPEALRRAREMGIRVVTYQPDNPFPPHHSGVPETLPAAAAADLYLTWSERLAASLRAHGIHAKYHPFGWDPEVMPYSSDRDRNGRTVIFVGGWDPERAAFLEALLRHVPIEIWGPKYWRTRTPPSSRIAKAWTGKQVTEAGMASLSTRSAISLNFLRAQHKIGGVFDGVIMRTFEVPGSGGFLLATRSGCATTHFTEGVSGAFFGDVEECAFQIDRYLSNPVLREEVAAHAHHLVDTQHRYDHRARELLDLIEGIPR